jgi:hypothetical protein
MKKLIQKWLGIIPTRVAFGQETNTKDSIDEICMNISKLDVRLGELFFKVDFPSKYKMGDKVNHSNLSKEFQSKNIISDISISCYRERFGPSYKSYICWRYELTNIQTGQKTILKWIPETDQMVS